MKHIYIFDELCNATKYGVGSYIQILIKVLNSVDWNVTVVVFSSNNDCLEVKCESNIRYIYIPAVRLELIKTRMYYRNAFYLLYPYINKLEQNILHLNYRNCKDIVPLLKLHFGFKVIVTWHYSSWLAVFTDNEVCEIVVKYRKNVCLPQNELLLIEKISEEANFLNNHCDIIVVLNSYTYNLINLIYQVPISKMKFIPNGIDDFFCKSNVIRDSKNEMNITDEHKLILFVGRLDDNKNLSLLIDSFHLIHSFDPNTHLVIVGSGNYDTFFPSVYPDTMYVHFMGFVDKSILYGLYNIAYCCVIPSLSEQCSYVVLEMMMFSKAIVANKIIGLKDIIEDGVSGLLVNLLNNNQQSVELLANAVIKLLVDKNQKDIYAKNARSSYLEYYTFGKFKEKMLDLYLMC